MGPGGIWWDLAASEGIWWLAVAFGKAKLWMWGQDAAVVGAVVGAVVNTVVGAVVNAVVGEMVAAHSKAAPPRAPEAP